MTLLVDAAGGCLKWAWLGAEGTGTGPANVLRWVEPEEWHAALSTLPRAPGRVIVANAAGPMFAARFREFARRCWDDEPCFVTATPEPFGAPPSLGVDRWLAMLAARRLAAAPLVVVSAGAAVAIDLVDAAGRHRGECVVPGTRLMREALHAQTSGVAAAALLDEARVDGAFGVNTAGAVRQGARLALAALSDRVVSAFAAEAAVPPRVFVTGVAADEVAGLMHSALVQAPDLVLHGLAVVAAASRP